MYCVYLTMLLTQILYSSTTATLRRNILPSYTYYILCAVGFVCKVRVIFTRSQILKFYGTEPVKQMSAIYLLCPLI